MSRFDDIELPAHAYVPGSTARHESGAFDHFCVDAKPGMDVEALASCLAWRAGLKFLEAGFFWEAHEVLESVWMALPKDSADRQTVQALIQYANAGLKQKMGRPDAASRLLVRASAHFRAGRGSLLARRLGFKWPDAERALVALVYPNPA